MPHNTRDEDETKGATEDDEHATSGNVGLEKQLGHRDQDPMLKDNDTDFPEPDAVEEHTGKPGS